MVFSTKLTSLAADDLAHAARVVDAETKVSLGSGALLYSKAMSYTASGDSLQQSFQHTAVAVKDALQAMQGASAAVLGTDGHRRHSQHEGVAYVETSSPPRIFLTPNVADTQHLLILVVQDENVDLGSVTTVKAVHSNTMRPAGGHRLSPPYPLYRNTVRRCGRLLRNQWRRLCSLSC